MKKLFQIAAVIAITSFSAQAHLIHSFHVKDKGPRGFKDVGSYSGFFIERKWCLNPGMLKCPWLCGEFVKPNGEAGNASHDLANFERQFIKKAIEDADKATTNSGFITQVFDVNGERVVLTAKFTKNESNFLFDVVKNNTYEANLKELESIDYVR